MKLTLPSNRMSHTLKALSFVAAFLMSISVTSASDIDLSKVYGVAIKGYDPVAYFTVGKAMKGDPAYAFDWNEATWHFSNEKHRDMFADDPQKYAPNHGGF